MATIVKSGTTIFDEMLESIMPQPQYGSIFYRVGCVKMSAPRHERFEWIREMGMPVIDDIFNNTDINSDKLTFVFPERHMSVHEQQHFTWAIKKHKDVTKIKAIDLITSSPLVIGGFHREQIRILTWDDDIKHSGNPNEDLIS